MTEDNFGRLALILWFAAIAYAARGGFRKRPRDLGLALLGYVGGFVLLMVAMVALAKNRDGGELAWIGFAPILAAMASLAIPVGFVVTRLIAFGIDRRSRDP